ncbi:NPH3 domain [Sesbania bispinosa]|nr:NPH3 domain [Sesbania bispinosa]
MTPTNVAAIRTAAELLGMTAASGEYGGEGLSHVAETYFRRVVGSSEEYASMVLRSCVPLLPEAETTASLVSRCIEELVSGDGEERCVARLNDVVEMQPQDFETVTASINRRLRSHDVLYQMVDLYLKENKFGKLTEEEKTRICNSIDCTKLSTETLVDCVQNPRMPLRFVVRAVLVEHLNTRHSLASMGTQQHQQFESNREQRQRRFMEETSVTLGDILRRDAALRQTAQLKAAMDSTNARIQSLEKELECMNKALLEHQAEEEEEQKNNEFCSERSASFHFVPSVENGRIERGERGSVSSSNIQFDGRIMEERYGVGRSSFSGGNPKMVKTFGQRLMSGLKNAFRVPSSGLSN